MIDYNFPQILGEAEILNERKMLTEVQSGLMMQGPESVRFIVIHCTATRADRDYTVEQMLKDHKQRGFRNIGYHFYIRKSGELSQHRKLLEVGAHAQGYNRCSIAVCYEGGLASPLPPFALRRNHRLLPSLRYGLPKGNPLSGLARPIERGKRLCRN